MNANDLIVGGFAAVIAVFFLTFLVVFFLNIRLWIQALLSGVQVSLIDIISMRLRRCPPQLIVHAMIVLRQRGVLVKVSDVEGYYLAAHISGQRFENGSELADLVQDVKQNNPDTPRPPIA